MITVKNLIIGGGISGLTLAYYLKDDYLILEKDDTIGGYCRTIPNKDYVWDYAGHFYHFKTEEFKKLFLSLVEPDEIIYRDKVTKIYYKDKLIDYPFQVNIHQLEKQEFIDCLYDLYFKEGKDRYDNFLDMLYGKFGKSIVEKFLRPYNEKLYATNLTNLDTDAMGRFFPYADFEGIMRNMKTAENHSYNDSFLYLKKGTQYFIDKLYTQLDQSKVKVNTEVTSVDSEKKIATLSNGDEIAYEYLYNTTPFNFFLDKLTDQSPTGIIDEMSYNKVLVLNLGFEKPSKNYTTEHWIYYPEKQYNFYRVGFYNNILGSDKLSLYVEIGYGKNDPVDIEGQLQASLENLRKVGILDSDNKLVDYTPVIMDPAYVHISGPTEAKLQQVKDSLEKKNIFTTGRYGKWTYSSMEDCMVWAKEIVEKVQQKDTVN